MVKGKKIDFVKVFGMKYKYYVLNVMVIVVEGIFENRRRKI